MPVQTLIDHLAGDHPLSEFFEDFPSVTREQALGVLEEAKRRRLRSM
ncbi:MAG TPA: DUF433 domain-containing protein [Longimicrobium sp.]|nr:DUF433 domain-containing protein [Longimicrobium sp.]